MAVAVKNTPETRTTTVFDRLAAASLAGVVYVLGSVGIVFKGLPALWGQLGLATDTFMGVALLVLVLPLVALVVLAVVGVRLAGPKPRVGLKAGIFMGLVLLLFLALIGRWIGGILEGWVYDGGWFPGSEALVGGIIAAVIVGLLALWLLRIFFRPGFEAWLVRFEEAGWFSARSFKPGQGLRVRRGTILGILLLAGSGIWVLVNRGTLGAGGWELNIPFTGKFVVDDIGDAASVLEKDPPPQYQVVDAGAAEGLEVDATLSLDRAKEIDEKVIGPLAEAKRKALTALTASLLQQALEKAVIQKPKLKDSLDAIKPVAAGKVTSDKKAARLVQESLEDLKKAMNNKEVSDPEISRVVGWIEMVEQFDGPLSQPGLQRFLVQREIDRTVKAEQEREKERKRVSKESAVGSITGNAVARIAEWAEKDRLPVLAPVLDRFRVRDINSGLDPLNFRIVKDTPPEFIVGGESIWFERDRIVNQSDFDAKVEEVKKRLKSSGVSTADVEDLAKKAAPPTKPMEGRVVYASITLLPAVRFTLPLLLLLLTIWLAWRIVNLPTFGDFLIATEAELNKVSWTTRTRLWQDTLVVLTTMILMAIFLFVVDIAWGKILSWPPIGVLQVKSQTEKPKDEANLKW
ncbi:MAG TPA: preprotein translocase subunit SecE [Gemmataceae bacterium]|nr:preprotein translocase subunit SecE [Gemmataceae bacterium]